MTVKIFSWKFNFAYLKCQASKDMAILVPQF